MKKKLSDLKNNEYVYCLSVMEQKRISGNVGEYVWINNKGESVPIEQIFPSNPLALVYYSKEFADYEPPKPEKPEKPDINEYWVKGVCDYVKYINDANKYCRHLEKELEDVKSKVFVPFKVKCNYGFNGIKKGKKYEVLFEYDGCYAVINDFSELDTCHKSNFTKID